jgi:DNA-binding NarL/FixJ family response regulator
MRYDAYGPEVERFEAALDPDLFTSLVITQKEKEALALAANGFALKEIAHQLNVSQSAIEKRILPLYKRFDVRNLPHLVSFAYRNFILD